MYHKFETAGEIFYKRHPHNLQNATTVKQLNHFNLSCAF